MKCSDLLRPFYPLTFLTPLFLSACVGVTSTPAILAAPTNVAWTRAVSTESPSPNLQLATTLTIPPLTTPTFVPPTSPLSELPLNAGNYWVYSSQVYGGSVPTDVITSTYRITDTILETYTSQHYFAAKLHRDLQFISGGSSDGFIGSLQPGDYWYIVSDTSVYQQIHELDLSQVESSWLEYVFPLSGKPCWFPNPDDRKQFDPHACNRGPDGPLVLDTSVGKLEDCYEILTIYLSGGTLAWFCSGIGVVRAKYDHHGSPFGYEEVLVDFSIQN